MLNGDVHRMVSQQEKLNGRPPFAPSWQDRLLQRSRLACRCSQLTTAPRTGMGDRDRTRPWWHGARVPTPITDHCRLPFPLCSASPAPHPARPRGDGAEMFQAEE